MNIFVLDENPVKAAQMHCDKHVVKMVLETAQILSTVMREKGIDYGYKATHKNHPCVRWAGYVFSNFYWTQALGIALCHEYTHRYGKRHKSQDIIEGAYWATAAPNILLNDPPASFTLAMPEQYKCSDAVASYRDYYRHEKSNMLQYTKREPPEWLNGIGTRK